MRKLWTTIFLVLAPLVAHCADFVVIAHPDVAITAMPRAALINLFFASPPAWPDGAPAVPFDMRDRLAKTEFYQQILGRSMPQVLAYRARQVFSGTGIPPTEIESLVDLVRRVAATPGAIAYVPRDRVNASVQIVTILP